LRLYPQDIVISDGQRDITCNEHVQQIVPGQRVLVRSAQVHEGTVFQVGGNQLGLVS
jgi:hypothetical protein